MRFPKSLRVNGREWKVEMSPPEDMGAAAGLCHYSKALISISTGQDQFDTRDTLLHEALHAILYQQGRLTMGNEEEEIYVRAISTGLMGVLQDNPLFAKWLIQPITSTDPS